MKEGESKRDIVRRVFLRLYGFTEWVIHVAGLTEQEVWDISEEDAQALLTLYNSRMKPPCLK